MSDLGTRSRKGMRDGISSPKECPERTWEQELGDWEKTDPTEECGKCQTDLQGGVDWNGGAVDSLSLAWRSGERTPSSTPRG